jgi:hypothetical protein
MTRAALATRAEVTAAPGYNHPPDRLPAPAARFPCLSINTQSGQKVARAPFNVDVVTEARALKIHCAVENLFHGPMKASGGSRGKPSGPGKWMDAGLEERLVRIDIAQPGEDLLVHQPALDGPVAAMKGLAELFPRDFARVGTEAG